MRKVILVIFAAIVGMAAKAQHWEMDFGDPNSYTVFVPGVVNNKGEAVLVGAIGADKNHYHPAIMSVTADGECTTRVYDTIEGNVMLTHVVQLDNGNYFASARVQENASSWNSDVLFMVLDSDFNLVAVKSYENPEMALNTKGRCLGRLMLDDDGTVVYSGGYDYKEESSSFTWTKPYFYRFDENGDTLSCRFVDPASPLPEVSIYQYYCYQLLKHPDSEGFVVLCDGLHGVFSFLRYDHDFNCVGATQIYPIIWESFSDGYSDHWLSDDKLLLMGTMWPEGIYTEWTIAMAEVGLDGTFGRWERVYHKQDTAIQAPTQCMVYVNDTTIYGGAYFYRSLGGENFASASLYATDMEVLGRKEFIGGGYDNRAYCSFIMPMSDGGCLIGTIVSTFYLGDYSYGKLIKMRREDFNPIPWSVKEVPQEALKALAFPNPAKDELHINISGLPEGKQHRIQITDALGHVCMNRIIRGSGNLLTVDVSSLKPGVYICTVFNSENEIVRNKFVKE